MILVCSLGLCDPVRGRHQRFERDRDPARAPHEAFRSVQPALVLPGSVGRRYADRRRLATSVASRKRCWPTDWNAVYCTGCP